MSRFTPAVLIASALLAGCADVAPEGTTSYTPSPAMRNVLAERVAMNAKRPSEVSIQEARDIPSVTDAAQAMPNVQGLPAVPIEVKQFNQLWGSGARARSGPCCIGRRWPRTRRSSSTFPAAHGSRGSDVERPTRPLASSPHGPAGSSSASAPAGARRAGSRLIHDDAFAAYNGRGRRCASWGADPRGWCWPARGRAPTWLCRWRCKPATAPPRAGRCHCRTSSC